MAWDHWAFSPVLVFFWLEFKLGNGFFVTCWFQSWNSSQKLCLSVLRRDFMQGSSDKSSAVPQERMCLDSCEYCCVISLGYASWAPTTLSTLHSCPIEQLQCCIDRHFSAADFLGKLLNTTDFLSLVQLFRYQVRNFTYNIGFCKIFWIIIHCDCLEAAIKPNENSDILCNTVCLK